jgi:hypothetical protein
MIEIKFNDSPADVIATRMKNPITILFISCIISLVPDGATIVIGTFVEYTRCRCNGIHRIALHPRGIY